ncbi:MAG: hypothetical protein ACP5KJ_03500 [Candidatus Micrarchaeia archaeon]
MRYVIKHIDVARAAKVCSLVHMLFFLLVGLVYGGVLAIISLVNLLSAGTDLVVGGISLAITLLSFIILPVVGAIYGAVLGAVLSFTYNLVVEYSGGLLVDVFETPQKQPVQKQAPQPVQKQSTPQQS